jgi:predicted nucleic acid-binding protein
VILVDTSVWVEHFKRGDARLAVLLDRAEVLCHPFIIGELFCGGLERGQEILGLLQALPEAVAAGHEEVLAYVKDNRLAASGIGWVDAHLLASAALSSALLWTHDRRLATVARTLSIGGESSPAR